MLQRNSLGALGYELVIAIKELGSSVGDGQPAALGARRVGCQ
jgi:hypothetical protein